MILIFPSESISGYGCLKLSHEALYHRETWGTLVTEFTYITKDVKKTRTIKGER